MEESVRRLFGKQYQVAKRDADGLLGCKHYARACKLKAKCCDLVVACRFCHDEEMGDDHEMDRFATERIVCMRCWKDQPVAARCVDCSAQFAHWFCKHCRFFENTPTKKVYHCDLCNICRLGEGLGIDNFHCHKCDACVSLESKSRHRCIGKALHANCPVCTGYLFTSTEPVVFMRCGHTMHSECFRQYTTRRFQCPLCMHSIVDMKKRFEYIDECVRNEPMPSEFHRKRSRILCNDCGNKCVAKYHFEHHKCDNDRCSSYNTRVLEEFDVPQEHHHSFYHASGEETAETMPHLPRDTVSALRLDEGGPNVVPCSVGAPSHGSTPDPS
ncbi:unnamed protein product [Chondrus crispus]|uniref:Uncharacterized protein n=1 Tax=Chondrus crispus TaxID=2769 RepID=R7QE64_CHOCR|nr:unnamed protein product [Chondrus crispus]CDF35751.1 unnamed protein product [Chondrus crispus]|eukprot:XP_005715570.1 unnamed protein product [Chondrus crispus]